MSTMREPRSSSRDPTQPALVTTIDEACYRQLYKLHKKLAIHQSHHSFLNACLRNGLTPTGLTIKTAPTIENAGPGRHVWTEWKHILHRTSILLMQVLKQHHLSMTDHLHGEIEKRERSLRRRSDFSTTKAAISVTITRAREELEERKQRKLDRLFRSRPPHVRRSRRKRKTRHAPTTATPSVQPDRNTVVNLSNVPLSEAEESLLSRGLSFCPTPPKLDDFSLENDLEDFYRRLRLREYFHNSDSEEENPQPKPFKPKNRRWTPAKNREAALEAYIQAVGEKVHERPPQRARDNLTREERTALYTLKQRIAAAEIVIKPADKGSATVIWSYSDYVAEAQR